MNGLVKTFVLCTLLLGAFGSGYYYHKKAKIPSPEARAFQNVMAASMIQLRDAYNAPRCENVYWRELTTRNYNILKLAAIEIEKLDPKLGSSLDSNETLESVEKFLYAEALDERDLERSKPKELQDFESLPCTKLYREMFSVEPGNISR